MVPYDMQTTSESRQLQHYSSFLVHPGRIAGKGNPSRGQNFKHCMGCSLYLEGKMSRHVII